MLCGGAFCAAMGITPVREMTLDTYAPIWYDESDHRDGGRPFPRGDKKPDSAVRADGLFAKMNLGTCDSIVKRATAVSGHGSCAFLRFLPHTGSSGLSPEKSKEEKQDEKAR